MRRSLLPGVAVVDGMTTTLGSTSTPVPIGDRAQGVVASTTEILHARRRDGGLLIGPAGSFFASAGEVASTS